jgi:hypothetical protein
MPNPDSRPNANVIREEQQYKAHFVDRPDVEIR